MILEALFAIDFLRNQVGSLNLQMQGREAFRTTDFREKIQGLFADAVTAMAGDNVKLIYKRITPVKFQAEAEGQNRVARFLAVKFEQENAPQERVRKQLL